MLSAYARTTARTIAALGAVALAAALLAMTPPTAAHADDDGVTPARVDGQTRFHTAANLATLTFDEAHVAHIVFGGDYPDALAASYGAGALDGPILPVPRHEIGGDHPTMHALDELGVDEVRLVGGTAAISAEVEQELADAGYETMRIAGQTRYETAAALATTYGDQPVGTLEGDRTALLASGAGFADALAAGPVAAAAGFPLLLTPTHQADAAVDDALEQLDIERIVIAGGPAAVSGSIVEHYEDRGYEVERWHGQTRTETAAVVADNARERLGFDEALTLLARGDDFADALAASVHGAVHAAPILLTATPTNLSDATGQWLSDRCPDVEVIRAIGGTAAVSDVTLAEAVSAAEACEEPAETNQSYIVSPQTAQQAAVGDEQEFRLVGTYDDGLLDAVELALFPCATVDVRAGVVAFADTTGDGYADRAGETDTGHAWISQINDVEQSEDQNRDRGMDPEDYNFHITSDAPDCTVPVLWGPGDHADDTQLPVDADGHPTVRFGIGQIEFVDG